MSAKECPLVLVEWLDSAQPIPAWQYLTDIDVARPIKCSSVGWLITNDKDNKRLAPNMGLFNTPESLQVSGVITIPTPSVTRMVRLKETRAFH